MTRGPHPLNHFFSHKMCYFRLDLALAACKLMNNSEEQHSSNRDLFYFDFIIVFWMALIRGLVSSEISHASSQYQLTRVCKCSYFEGPTKRLTESLMTWRPLRPLNHLYSERDVLLQARLSAGSVQSDDQQRRAAQQQSRSFYFDFIIVFWMALIRGLVSSEIRHASSQYQLTRVCKCSYFGGPTKRLTESLMTWRPLRPLNHLYSERDVLLQARLSAGSSQSDDPERRASWQSLTNI